MKKKEKTLKNGNDFAKKKQKKVSSHSTKNTECWFFPLTGKKVISNHNYNFQNNLSLASEMYPSQIKKW